MNTMKKIVSSVLLLCMMAALMCVPAHATGVFSLNVTGPAQLDGNNPDGVVKYFATVSGDLNPRDVKWYKDGNEVAVKGTDANGTCYVEFKVSAFGDIGSIYATTVYGGQTITSNTINVTKTAPSQAQSITLDNNRIEMYVGDSAQLRATVNGSQNNSLAGFYSEDTSIATIRDDGVINGVAEGTTTVWAYVRDSEATKVSCTVKVSVNDSAYTNVTIQPVPSSLKKGQTVDLVATVTGSDKKAVFDHWRVENSTGHVRIANEYSERTQLTALATSSSPIRLWAYAKDGTSAYVEFTIAAADSLQLDVYPAKVSYGNVANVYVVNPLAGEEFTWSITPSAANGVLAKYSIGANSVDLTAGSVEGRIQVTATSKMDVTRTDSVVVYVNSEAAYGNASIKPNVATWTAGQGNLVFEVSPAFYSAYVDGKLLTPASGYYTYYNGILTIKTNLLSSLSSGEHSLKVYTSNGNGADGLVYATIYINGTAKNVYGDNAHVRGSAYNLYFTSSDPIKDVYINNQWIDPANYTLSNDGKYLTLKSDFLNRLGYGSYNMKLVTQNGYNENASFRIVTANYAPSTGDDANMGAWVMLMLISLAGAAVLIPKKKAGTDIDVIG